MNKTPDGGRAIPDGLTLHDWFAGMALSGLSPAGYDKWANLVTDAYNIADAMLVEKAKRDEPK